MKIDFFNSEKILRLTPVADETKEVADQILVGNVRVFSKLRNVKVKALSELWEMNFDLSPSTYALYVYALYPVSYLINAYEVTDDVMYLEEALKAVLDFLNWELRDHKGLSDKRERILFGDHAVSNRTQALCYLVCSLKSRGQEIPPEVKSALLRNGEYLADINNYSHYNHGLMMDLALLGLLNTLEGITREYPVCLRENLTTRLHHSITRDLTEDGVHVENSPGYHFWMLGFLKKITPPLKLYDEGLYLKAKAALKKASEYAKYITQPDGAIPAIGDTHAGLRFRPINGLESKFFKCANQVIFREADDKVWAFFSSGYKTHVHKHCDNGAFNLFCKGHNFFIDPGFLNYENQDDSMLIRSARCHNIARPIGFEQNILKTNLKSEVPAVYTENLSKSKVLGFVSSEFVELAACSVFDYENFELVRVIVYVKRYAFLIIDKLYGGFGIESFFNLDPKISVDFRGRNLLLKSPSGEAIELRALALGGVAEVSFDLTDVFVAKEFGGKVASKQIHVKSKTSSSAFMVFLSGFDENSSTLDEMVVQVFNALSDVRPWLDLSSSLESLERMCEGLSWNTKSCS